MIIGTFTYDDATDTFTGTVAGLAFDRLIEIRPATKTVDKEPDYRVVMLDKGTLECGAGWKRTGRDKPYVSISLDDPTFHQALNVVLEIEANNKCLMKWIRQKRKNAKA